MPCDSRPNLERMRTKIDSLARSDAFLYGIRGGVEGGSDFLNAERAVKTQEQGFSVFFGRSGEHIVECWLHFLATRPSSPLCLAPHGPAQHSGPLLREMTLLTSATASL